MFILFLLPVFIAWFGEYLIEVQDRKGKMLVLGGAAALVLPILIEELSFSYADAELDGSLLAPLTASLIYLVVVSLRKSDSPKLPAMLKIGAYLVCIIVGFFVNSVLVALFH